MSGRLMLLLTALQVISIGCRALEDDKPGTETPGPTSDDGTVAQKTPEGFSVIEPHYLGLKQDAEDSKLTDSEFLESQCAGQAVGSFFSALSYSDDHSLYFCLGPFARPENSNYEQVCVDCRDKINLTNLYVGIATDKILTGVADVSMVVIAETADFIRSSCEGSNFSSETLTAGYGNKAVNKLIMEQMLTLQQDSGVCSNVRLHSYQNLQNIFMETWFDRSASFALSRVELEGRQPAE